MFDFLNGLDPDLSGDLLATLRDQWAGEAAESQSDLPVAGETTLIFAIRVKPCGRPLDEYQKIAGHLAAIRWLSERMQRGLRLAEPDLFELHRILMARLSGPPDEPVGAWKSQPNGTWMQVGDEAIYYQYAAPEDVPCLMRRWLDLFNADLSAPLDMDQAAESYARFHLSFVWIHPFCDANGRMARLLANVPLLNAGFPPILIPRQRRDEYIRLLTRFKLMQGRPDSNTSLCLPPDCVCGFCDFCKSTWQKTLEMVQKARQLQEKRRPSAH